MFLSTWSTLASTAPDELRRMRLNNAYAGIKEPASISPGFISCTDVGMFEDIAAATTIQHTKLTIAIS